MSTMVASPIVDRENTEEARRNANYKPNIWNYDHLIRIFLTSKYNDDKYRKEAETLKAEVSEILCSEKELLPAMELINEINKLALSHYFEKDINEALNAINNCKSMTNKIAAGSYSAALYLRIFAENGRSIPHDVMIDLREEYSDKLSSIMSPLQRSVIWFNVKDRLNNARYNKHDEALHKLAVLNFNRVQSQHQNELISILRWWKDLGLSEVLTFTRNRTVESFLWAAGIAYEPQLESLRKWLTKAIIMVLIIDDVYDIYGSMHELEKFTAAVERWDAEETKKLPEAMKKCFWMLHKTLNEIDLEVQREKGWSSSVLPHLKEVWTGFCKAMLVEAKWYHTGYKPSIKEYIKNGWISSSGVVLSLHILFGIGQDMKEAIEVMKDRREIVRNVSIILRLCNDQGTSKAEMERGDVPSSIVCYMREANVTEREARDHIGDMIACSWKKLNGLFIRSPRSNRSMISHVINIARVASFVYANGGDGVSDQGRETREHVLSCLIQPLPL